LLHSLAVFSLIKGYFKLSYSRYKALSIVLTNRLATAYT
jgi:hypothetical protein